MSEVLPRDILLRVGGTVLARHGVLAVGGAARGLREIVETFSRADASTCATFIDRTGVLRLAAANIPRIEWVDLDGDGVRERMGIRLEGERTNLCLRSEELDHAAWGGAAGVTANNAVAPDGATTADTLTDDDAGVFESRTQAFTVANDSLPHVVGVFVKKTTGATNTFGLNLSLTGGTGVNQFPRLNTNSGVTSAGSDTRAISVGDYWLFICKITNNGTGNTTLSLAIFPATGTNSGSNPGTDSATATGSAVVWGVQVEKAAMLSSYIRTAGAAVTRAADNMSFPLGVGPATDLTMLARVARPLHADATGVTAFCHIASLGWLDNATPSLFLNFENDERQFQLILNTPTTDAEVFTLDIPAGQDLVAVAQMRNAATTGGLIRGDVGAGFSDEAGPATPFTAWGAPVLRVGGLGFAGTELYGVLLDVIVARGLFSRAEMLAIP